MSEATAALFFYPFVLAVIVITVAWIELRALQLARGEVADEIANNSIEPDAMYAAVVGGEANRDKSRKLYIRQRVHDHKRAHRIGSYKAIGRAALSIACAVLAFATIYGSIKMFGRFL